MSAILSRIFYGALIFILVLLLSSWFRLRTVSNRAMTLFSLFYRIDSGANIHIHIRLIRSFSLFLSFTFLSLSLSLALSIDAYIKTDILHELFIIIERFFSYSKEINRQGDSSPVRRLNGRSLSGTF